MTIDEEKQELFTVIRHLLGAPVRKVELTDEQMCSFLKVATEDYAKRVQNFIIESNWMGFYGKNNLSTMNAQDWAFALSVRTMDMAKEFSYYFSKEVGLQQRGPWELKKDFFEIEPGRQVYVIPAGREINKVLYITPPTTDPALFANYGGFTAGFGGGVVGQLGLGGGAAFAGLAGAGFGGMYAMPIYDVALTSVDMKEKNKMLGCDLTYKVTAGPNGTHFIHLSSVPGGRFERMGGFGRRHPMYCWYTYYDTTNATKDECDELINGSNGDVLLSPDQVPLGEMNYAFLNTPAKVTVRQLMMAIAARTLGLERGKFSGNINMINAPLTMDYNMLLSIGKEDYDNVIKELDERLARLSPYEQMEKQAAFTKNLIDLKKAVPLGIYVK